MPRRSVVLAAGLGAVALGLTTVPGVPSALAAPRPAASKHVLLLSIDGLHNFDLANYTAQHPDSPLARLVAGGTSYPHARTTFPSDSFPGMVAQLTGGKPGSTGVYYDDTFNHTLLPPGTLDCSAAATGTEVAWTEAADRSQNPITLDAGQRLADPALTALATNTRAQTLAASKAITKAILALTPTPQSLLDPAALPVDPATCTPVYPHRYLKVNTVFEVARAHGLRTAWSDKHAAYEILNGPSGTGVQDLFTPEINSVADSTGEDWTKDDLLTQEYDRTKVAAVLNEIDGLDHSGTHAVGTPAVFGMNFQAVSVAEKLPTSDDLAGGYHPDGTPGPLLIKALEFVDSQVGALQAAIDKRGLTASTTIILSAKHGQSPTNLATLRRIDDGAVTDGLNAGWLALHPGSAPLVVFSVDDDGMLLWLSDRTPAAAAFAKHYLLSHPALANLAGQPKSVHDTSVESSGLSQVATGQAAAALFGPSTADGRTPDVVGIAQPGVVYTGGVAKIAEHGGAAAEDRDVPLVVSGAGARSHVVVGSVVETTQIAPSILKLLGLDPDELQAVQHEHTRALPRL